MAELTPEREAELERGREQERNLWRISESLGLPQTDAEKVWGMVRLEMKFYCQDFMRGLSIAVHAKRWIETRNPFHIDAAVRLCHLAGTRPPPALAELVAEVATKRLSGDVCTGTAGKLFRDAAKDHALSLMTNLCAAGLSREAAASKAAANLAHSGFGISYKASSLHRWYEDQPHWRSMEARRREYWQTDEGAHVLAEWLRLIPEMPDVPEVQRHLRH